MTPTHTLHDQTLIMSRQKSRDHHLRAFGSLYYVSTNSKPLDNILPKVVKYFITLSRWSKGI